MSIRKIWHAVRGWWGGFVLLAFFTYTHFLTKNFNRKMRQERRYTIGEVYGTHWTLKAGKFADATFQVNGHEYLVSANADALAGQELVGKRFLVKFHPPDPLHYNVIYLEVPVPDSTQAIMQGWLNPPFNVPEWIFKINDK